MTQQLIQTSQLDTDVVTEPELNAEVSDIVRNADITDVVRESDLENTLEGIYPVGAIFLSTQSANPATTFGFGTWSRIAEGRTLVGEGMGAGLTTRTAGTTGGVEDAIVVDHEHSNIHTHSIDHPHGNGTAQLAGDHSHQFVAQQRESGFTSGGGAPDEQSIESTRTTADAGAHTHSVTIPSHSGDSGPASNPNTGDTGVDGTDQNMMPYLVVYMWERVA